MSRHPGVWISIALLAATRSLALTPAAQPAAAAPAKAATPAATAAKRAEKLVSIVGTLDIVFSASVFGPGTSFDPKTGALVSQMSAPGLAIDYNGKSLNIEVSRQTRLDDSLKAGMVNTAATYKVSGYVRDNRIVATSLIKIKDPDPTPPAASPLAATPPAATTAASPVPAPAASSNASTEAVAVASARPRPAPAGFLADRLAGSTWQVQNQLVGADWADSQWDLRPDGTVVRRARYASSSEHNTWEIADASVVVKINDAYSIYTTSELNERTMSGTATNKVGKQWTWTAKRTTP